MNRLKRFFFSDPRRAAAVFIPIFVLFIQLPVVFSPRSYLLSWFNIDDGFYYFVIARNIASGAGVTFDGISATNGFHPLWMLILTPIFGLPGKILPLRVLAGLLIALNAGTAALVFRLTSRRLAQAAAAITALAFAFLPAIHHYTARGGMEVGLSVFLTVLVLDRLAAWSQCWSASRVLILSLLASLTFLARLDHIFLAGFIGLAILARTWGPPDQFTQGRWHWRARQALLFYGPLIAVLAAYILWNQIGFGTPTPVSSQVKRWWGTLDNSVYGFPPRQWVNYIGQFVTDDPNLGPWSLVTGPLYASAEGLVGESVANRRIALAAIGTGVALVAAAIFLPDRRRMLKNARELGLGLLLLACLFQIAYYKGTGSVAQRPWYWVNESLLLVLLGGLFLDAASRSWARRVRSPVVPALISAVLALLLIMIPVNRLRQIFSPETAARTSFYDIRSDWLEQNTEPGARIGMTGTGSSAYFTTDRSFFNLDGLVNSHAYFQALREGTAGEIIAASGVDYIFGNAYIILVSEPYGDIFSGRLEPVASFNLDPHTLYLWQFSDP